MTTSPVIIFAFNRPDSLKATIEALSRNPEAAATDLYIYVDGARAGKEGEAEKVKAVRDVASAATGFKSVVCRFSVENRGLGLSIIAGVSEVIEKHGTAIVLEDDLTVQPNFLAFMNQGLAHYADDEHVFSICGYTNRITTPRGYAYDAYACVRSSSWGWATWRDRWASVDWTLADWAAVEANRRRFNSWGGSDCFGMLRGWRIGANKSWAIRFCYAQFVQDKVSIFPVKSLLTNCGFDGEGTNCKKWSRFKYDLMSASVTDFRFPPSNVIDKTIRKSFLFYNGLPIRIWSKLMYILHP